MTKVTATAVVFGILIKIKQNWLNCFFSIFKRNFYPSVQFSHSVVSNSAIPWTAACPASLSITNSQSLLKLMASFSERCSCEGFPFIDNNVPKTRLRGHDLLSAVQDTHRLTHGLCVFSNVWERKFPSSPDSKSIAQTSEFTGRTAGPAPVSLSPSPATPFHVDPFLRC